MHFIVNFQGQNLKKPMTNSYQQRHKADCKENGNCKQKGYHYHDFNTNQKIILIGLEM